MIAPFHDLGQPAVGRHARKLQPGLLQPVAIGDVDLVAMAMALLDAGRAIDRRRARAFGQDRVIGAQPHRAALVVVGLRCDGVVALHPFLEVIDHRLEPLLPRPRGRTPPTPRRQPATLRAASITAICMPEADAQIWDLALAREFGGA
jgi:hypothetical protein